MKQKQMRKRDWLVAFDEKPTIIQYGKYCFDRYVGGCKTMASYEVACAQAYHEYTSQRHENVIVIAI